MFGTRLSVISTPTAFLQEPLVSNYYKKRASLLTGAIDCRLNL